jgi:hypothetical protein
VRAPAAAPTAAPSALATAPTPAAPAPAVLAAPPPAVLAATPPAVLAATPPEPPTPAPPQPAPAPAPPPSPAPAGTQPPPLAADKPAEPHPLTGSLTLPGVAIEAKPPAPVGTEPVNERSAPHPAAAVALGPAPRSRAESQGEVLSNWAWKTDSVTAIDDDEDVHAPGTSNRKLLVYLIGGGVALASLVAIIMVGFGSNHAKKTPTAAKPAATQVAAATPAPAPAATAPTPPPPAAGSAIAPDPGSAAAPAAGSDEATASDGSAAPAATPPPPEAPTPPPATPPPPPETHAPPPETHAPPAETHAPTRPTVAHASHADHERRSHSKADRTGALVAYHEGLMKFTRGDLGAAVAALHSALAADPGYAPTWRMLGLVYEKAGDKPSARAAFHHYLQLDPGANDAAQIRQRLEKLGS